MRLFKRWFVCAVLTRKHNKKKELEEFPQKDLLLQEMANVLLFGVLRLVFFFLQ